MWSSQVLLELRIGHVLRCTQRFPKTRRPPRNRGWHSAFGQDGHLQRLDVLRLPRPAILIQKLNKKGKRPPELIDYKKVELEFTQHLEEDETDFVDVTGQIELPPEEKKRRRGRGGKRRSSGGSSRSKSSGRGRGGSRSDDKKKSSKSQQKSSSKSGQKPKSQQKPKSKSGNSSGSSKPTKKSDNKRRRNRNNRRKK